MTARAVAVRIRVSAQNYADAARQLRDGNTSANPLALPLLEAGEFALAGQTAREIVLRDIHTGQRFAGIMPAGLAKYLSGFRHGARVLGEQVFELALASDD